MDPYVEVCRRLEEAGVRYLIVGVFGINFYAGQVGEIITTGDCDILIEPQLRSLRKSLQTLVGMGFALEAGGEPLGELDAPLLRGILRARAAIRAERADAHIDLCTQVAGTGFRELWASHREFVVDGVRLRVGPLQGLVASKQTADRPKDRLFLELHKELIDALLRRRKRGR